MRKVRKRPTLDLLSSCAVRVSELMMQLSRSHVYRSTWHRRVSVMCRKAVKNPLSDQVQEELLDSKGSSCYLDGSEVPLGFHVVSIQAKSRFRRLHCVGSCHRRPGKDYGNVEVLGPEEPSASAFDARCRDCFRQVRTEASDVSSSSGSSSSECGI